MERQSKNEKLLQYFKDICRIPRQTSDEEAISQYLLDFAKARGLQAERDAHHNVLIRKPSTIPGYKGPTVIVQGHMDIVYEKSSFSGLKFTEPVMEITCSLTFIISLRMEPLLVLITDWQLLMQWICWIEMICRFRPWRF